MDYDPRRQFGYPVLRENQNISPSLWDYPNMTFDFAWGHCSQGPEFLAYQLGCEHSDIRKAIEDKTAAYFLSVRCSRTLFHEVTEIFDATDLDQEESTYRIPFEHLNGRFKIQLFILGKENSSIKSDQFNEFFGIDEFQFSPGQILAYSPEYELDTEIEETSEPLQIFKIDVSEHVEDGIFKLVLKDSMVSILVSKAQRARIRALENQGSSGISILRASIQVPVLQHLIELVLADKVEDQLWVDYIRDELDELEDDLLNDPPYLEAAQLIANKPLALINQILGD